MSRRLITGVLVGCLLAFVAVFAFAQTGSNVRWEYTSIHAYTSRWSHSLRSNMLQEMNALGEQGWEYVSSHGGNLIFRRRAP